MAPPPVQLFMTTIASQPALRQRQETLLRVLQVKKIPFDSYDLASDPEAKTLWRRKAPSDKQQLPGILVGGEFPGTYAEFEVAVEDDELDTFLRLKEDFVPSDFDPPSPIVKPVGVPGAYSPSEMNPTHRSPSRSPGLSPPASPLAGKGRVIQMDEELATFGIHDDLTEDDLATLVAELGLEQGDASDLVRGLSKRGSKSKPTITLERPSGDLTREKKAVVEALSIKIPVLKLDVKALAVDTETPASEVKLDKTTAPVDASVPVIDSKASLTVEPTKPEEPKEIEVTKSEALVDEKVSEAVTVEKVPEPVVEPIREAQVEPTSVAKAESIAEVAAEITPVVEGEEQALAVTSAEKPAKSKLARSTMEIEEPQIRGRRGTPAIERVISRELKTEEVVDEKGSSVVKTEGEDGEMYIPEFKNETKSAEVSATSE
ncbi:hypothetical protein EUX98_g180 [Antrodiella citrinella]|uniref:Uncharacterized protein n=1 Tax=Antrodiella citrinella TaxID=2447956 RepID=A0A4S4NDE8_9APHY|nr:hypothetical protein EUX98_g180 [Antrodiella citrinella]